MDGVNEGYQKIVDLIKGKIEWGVYKPGDKVFSERELAEKYNTNRMVVKDAIQTLVDKGYLKKVQGKGTFVVKSAKQSFVTKSGFSLDTLKENLTSYRVISKGIVSDFTEMNKKLNLNSKDKLFRIQRVCLVEGEPAIYHDTYIPNNLFPGIDMEDFDVISPLDYMEHKGVNIIDSPQTITTQRLNDREAKHLNVDPETEVLTFEYFHKDRQGRFVEYTKMYCLCDRAKFLVL